MATEDFTTLTQSSPMLTNERVSKALSDWFGDILTFTHWQYVGETGKGDSYLSEVMRIKIHGKKENGESKYVQVILKNIPRSLSRRLTYRCDEFFKNEIMFYTNVLPVLLKFQSSKNISDPFTQYAKIFLMYSDGTNDVICLEDASLYNYGCAVRQEGVDIQHCKTSFKALAQYHALSFAMRDQQPKEFERAASTVFETYYHDNLWGWYERFWKTLCGIATDAVEKEYPNSIYFEKIKEFAIPETYKSCSEAVKNTYKTGVMSHGDSWTNNFLYKYEDGKPVEAMLIDFQLTRCASPVLDLSFFIYACTSQELRLKHYNELLKYYHDILSKQIKELGSNPDKLYSWESFMDEIKKYSFFGLAFSFESTPFIVLAPEDAVNMEMKGDEKMNIDDIWQMKPFKTKEGRLREANNVVHCVDNGYI